MIEERLLQLGAYKTLPDFEVKSCFIFSGKNKKRSDFWIYVFFELKDDMQRVFSNAIWFNERGSQIVIDARRLRDIYKRNLAKIKPSVEAIFAPEIDSLAAEAAFAEAAVVAAATAAAPDEGAESDDSGWVFLSSCFGQNTLTGCFSGRRCRCDSLHLQPHCQRRGHDSMRRLPSYT
jgi:hypothetical protein